MQMIVGSLVKGDLQSDVAILGHGAQQIEDAAFRLAGRLDSKDIGRILELAAAVQTLVERMEHEGHRVI